VPAEEYERLKSGRPDFWQALQSFRQRTRLASLDLDDPFAGVRSRSTGRDFEW
jgi:hypothetical protein